MISIYLSFVIFAVLVGFGVILESDYSKKIKEIKKQNDGVELIVGKEYLRTGVKTDDKNPFEIVDPPDTIVVIDKQNGYIRFAFKRWEDIKYSISAREEFLLECYIIKPL